MGILVDELKDKVPATYISSLLDGFPKSQSIVRVVLEKVRRLKVKNLWKKILTENNKQTRLFEKGIDPDPSKLQGLFKELDILNNGNQQILKSLSSISPKEIDWLWWNFIPRGSLTLFVGDPGDGKSILCEYLAARFSKGDPLPDKSSPGQTGNIIFITAEDGLADTVRVRADEAGANCEKIHVLDGLLNNEIFSLVKHIPQIETEIERIGDVCLIVFDPITAFDVPIISSSKDAGKTVRARLIPIVRIAEKYNVAVIGVTHCNKDQAKKAIYRVLGDIAFAAAARTVWLIQRDENDETHQRRFFSPLKYNLCKNPTTLAFSIDGPLGHPKITFEPDPVDISATELLSDDESKDNYSALKEAREWLREILKEKSISAKEILKIAREDGISERTLKRAKSQLNVESFKADSGWFWGVRNA